MKFPSVHKFAALKKKLKNAHKDWVQSFLDNGGLDVLLDCVDDIGTKRVNLLSDALLLLECVSCIKRLVNNQSGVAYLVQHGSYTRNSSKVRTAVIYTFLIILSKLRTWLYNT